MVRRKEKELNMKIISTLAAIGLLAAMSGNAEVLTKGGATKLMTGPVVRPGAPTTAAMKCAACKSEYVTVKIPTFKGTVPQTATFERHGCNSCDTKWVTTGHGKAKVQTAVHGCANCAM